MASVDTTDIFWVLRESDKSLDLGAREGMELFFLFVFFIYIKGVVKTSPRVPLLFVCF